LSRAQCTPRTNDTRTGPLGVASNGARVFALLTIRKRSRPGVTGRICPDTTLSGHPEHHASSRQGQP
jgi:hypothetical protein